MEDVFADIVRSLWRQPPVLGAPRWSGWDLVVMPVVVICGVVDIHAAGLGWPALRLMTVVVLGGLLLVRRARPLVVALTFTGLVAAVSVALVVNDHEPLVSALLAPVVVFSLVRWASGRHIVIGLTGLTPLAVVVSVLASDTEPLDVFVSPTTAVLFWLSPCLLGYVARAQMEIRDQRVHDAQRDERQRIARELHDSVAHHVSGIAIQAKAARAVSGLDPAGADEAMAMVERSASVALDEMRQMVGALRYHDGPVLTPLEGIAELEDLAQNGTAGPDVEVSIVGEYATIAAPVQTALYRIAQEAVTNARRHATNASRVMVTVVVTADAIDLCVANDGDRARTPPSHKHGHGLTGIAERVSLLGGNFDAGPDPRGGWTVTATIPRATDGSQ
jgi:signal transduction histidine kinase